MFDNQEIKKIKLRDILYTLITCLFILNYADVLADSLKLKETQTDKLKCKAYKEENGQKYKECDQLTTGKFSITVKISAKTFQQYGVIFSSITPETLLGINIGSYQFSGTLADAVSAKLTTKNVKGRWSKTHEACIYNIIKDDDDCNTVEDGSVKITVSPAGANIKLTGKRAVNEDSNFGDQVFLGLCGDTLGKSKQQASSNISIGDIIIPSDISVNCKVVKTNKSTSDDAFELVNVGISAKLKPKK